MSMRRTLSPHSEDDDDDGRRGSVAMVTTMVTSMPMTKTRWHTNLLGAFAVWRAPYSSLDRSTISFWVNNVDFFAGRFFPLFIRAIFVATKKMPKIPFSKLCKYLARYTDIKFIVTHSYTYRSQKISEIYE